MPSEAGYSALDRAVREAVDRERIGRPSFVRCVAIAPDGETDATFDSLLSLTEGWLGGAPDERTRQGGAGQSHVFELLKWPGGEGGLIMVSESPSVGAPALDLMVIGSRGTIYHQA